MKRKLVTAATARAAGAGGLVPGRRIRRRTLYRWYH
jgi:hypothetical protein